MEDLWSKVTRHIEGNRDRILALCSELIRTRSINPNYPGVSAAEVLGGETTCNEKLAEHYQRIGCRIDLWEGAPRRCNLVGVLPGSGGGRSLIFNGHVDTVPVTQPEKWKFGDPFSGVVEDGRLYGRGASDMKTGLVAQLMAATALKESGVKLKGDLILESVIGEETMDHELGTTATIKRGYTADAAIVSEPTAPPTPLAVVPITPGLLWMGVTCRGKATHASIRGELIRAGGKGAEIGVNAIEKGVLVLQALQKLEEEWGQSKSHALFRPGHFTIHPGVIVGGPHGVLIPFLVSEFCTIEYAIWYPPQEDVDRIKQEIEDYVLQASRLDPWLRSHPPEIEWKLHWPPSRLDRDHPIALTCLAAHLHTTGSPPEIAGRPRVHGFCAVCDATFLNAAGIPSVVYGPGTLEVAHAVNEYVATEEVITATKVYARAAMEWCGI
jgi:acetylornithine deacetylase/succinyl-diaminopimelate desuccinylase family protein